MVILCTDGSLKENEFGAVLHRWLGEQYPESRFFYQIGYATPRTPVHGFEPWGLGRHNRSFLHAVCQHAATHFGIDYSDSFHP